MNQALIGGIAGASPARGLATLNRRALAESVFSWFFTPVLAGVAAFLLYLLASKALGLR
jgi:phosphate/sulfate permease